MTPSGLWPRLTVGQPVIPAKIHDDRVPAEGLKMFLHPRRVGKHLGFADGIAKGIVTVPTHRRRQRQGITADDFDFRFGCAGGILSANCEFIIAGFYQ